MILFFSETTFKVRQKKPIKNWLIQIAKLENRKVGDINIVFLNDEQLLKFNKQYLKHNMFTDIITFDYSEGNFIHGDIFVSVDRIIENSQNYGCGFEEELRRVMVHGVFHLCGYKDKEYRESKLMKQKEEDALVLFNTIYKL
ncbi:MAG: rRNA maturation RNase YbeY [Bacteroidales bacterium]|jgi:rRNA maturation RNase YbeY|nr:rRNA maturation RNase YbeY [Bacteroidales bacterium]